MHVLSMVIVLPKTSFALSTDRFANVQAFPLKFKAFLVADFVSHLLRFECNESVSFAKSVAVSNDFAFLDRAKSLKIRSELVFGRFRRKSFDENSLSNVNVTHNVAQHKEQEKEGKLTVQSTAENGFVESVVRAFSSLCILGNEITCYVLI